MTTLSPTHTPDHTPDHVQPNDAVAGAKASDDAAKLFAVVAEFDNVDDVMSAARTVRDAGYKRWDIHSPFPIHGLDPEMGIQRTILPYIVFVCGLSGVSLGAFLTIWSMTDPFSIPSPWGPIEGYEYLISGKPSNSIPAYIPVWFELTILLSAFGAFFGMWALNLLPKHYHPLQNHPTMHRATDDRFFVVIEARDQQFDEQKVTELLDGMQPLSLEKVNA